MLQNFCGTTEALRTKPEIVFECLPNQPASQPAPRPQATPKLSLSDGQSECKIRRGKSQTAAEIGEIHLKGSCSCSLCWADGWIVGLLQQQEQQEQQQQQPLQPLQRCGFLGTFSPTGMVHAYNSFQSRSGALPAGVGAPRVAASQPTGGTRQADSSSRSRQRQTRNSRLPGGSERQPPSTTRFNNSNSSTSTTTTRRAARAVRCWSCRGNATCLSEFEACAHVTYAQCVKWTPLSPSSSPVRREHSQ